VAQKTASWNNTQPWQVVIASGAAVERFRAMVIEKASRADPPASDFPNSLDMDVIETWAIRRALAKTGGNVSQAARRLGINRTTLYNRMENWHRP